jgi:hypothetical protein
VEIVLPAVSYQDPERRYRVVLSDAGDTCECADFYWRHVSAGDQAHRCKHIRAARQMLVEGIPGPRRQPRRAAAAPRPAEQAA